MLQSFVCGRVFKNIIRVEEQEIWQWKFDREMWAFARMGETEGLIKSMRWSCGRQATQQMLPSLLF